MKAFRIPVLFLSMVALLLSGCNGLRGLRSDATELMNQGRVAEAKQKYREACRKYPWVAIGCFKWGLLAQRLKQYDEAVLAYNKTLKINPRITSAYNNLGAIAWMRKDLKSAEAYFRKAISLDPSNAVEAHNNLALLLMKRGKAKLALRELHNAKYKWPNALVMKSLQVNLGRAYFYLGEYKQSIEEYLSAVELDPNNIHAHNNLGVLFAKLGNFSKARVHLGITLKLRPGDATPHYNMGLVAFLQGKFRESVNSNTTALKNSPDFIRAYNNMAMAYYRLGDFIKAQQALRRSLTINSRYGAAYNGLAVLAIAKSKYKEAIKLLGQAINNTPLVATFHFNLGLTHFKTKEYHKALSAFERAHELDPKFPGVQENIKALRNLIEKKTGGTLPHPRIKWRLGGGKAT